MPIARYFIFVGATLAAFLLIADWCLPTPPAMFAKQLVIDRSIIRIKSARKWPEKVVLKTSQPIIALRAVEESPAAQSASLPPDEAGDQSNLEALAQLKSDTLSAVVDYPTMRIERGLARAARSKRVAGGPVLRVVVSLGGSTMVKRARMPCRAGAAASSWAMDWPAPIGGIER